MAKNDENVSKEWIKNLWINCNKSSIKNESLWSRVSEMVYAFNGERQTRVNNLIMKPDSVPVGVDCTLSPILPNSVNCPTSRSEYCVLTSTSTASVVPLPVSTAVATSDISATNSTELPVKRVVCSPDLPVYSFVSSGTHSEVKVETFMTTESVPDSQPKVYHCTICSEGFNQKISLTAHLKTHSKESDDPYQCNFCGKKFAVPARLTRHYRTHTGEKPYQCEYCNKSFSVKENLSVHKRIHTKERPYKCDVCDRAFEHSGKLHRHMRIHTGERPHKCNFCSKTFIQSGQLVIHLRTHTGEKPYVCKCCNKGFTCSKQLKVHTRTHTGEKPYACDICGKSFGYNHVLKLHQVAHYGEKVYKCTICQETFNSKKSMETHIKMAHSESNAARNGGENESLSTPSVSDKENKMDVASAVETKYTHSPSTTVSSVNVSEPNSSVLASTLSTMKPVSETRHSSSSSSFVYENYPQSLNGNAERINEAAAVGSYETLFYAPSLPNTHSHQGGLNSALLAAAAAATEELAMTYQTGENSRTLLTYPSKFQIPVVERSGARYGVTSSPSSYSDSSRSSPSPKLEIVEPPEDASCLYILPDDELHYRGDHSSLTSSTVSPSVIMVPYAGGLTPSSSSSTSPIPSPTNLVDFASKDELSLPPRKRTKMILKSMEKEKMEDSNFRYNSVIQYAKASQIA